VLLQAGAGVPADPARARGLLGRACEGGVAEACRELERAGEPR